MHILGRDTLGNLQKNNKWIAVWLCELAHARGWGSADVFNQFPKAQECGNNVFLFQTAPKEYCIEVQFDFLRDIAVIRALKAIENK